MLCVNFLGDEVILVNIPVEREEEEREDDEQGICRRDDKEGA